FHFNKGGGTRSGGTNAKPGVLSTGSIGRDEDCYGDLQQPSMVVDSPTNSILSLSNLGDAIVQPAELGTTSCTNIPPTPTSTKSRGKCESMGKRKYFRTVEGNKNRNSHPKGHKSNDIQREVRQKYILICSPNLSKSSIDIRTSCNPEIENYVVMNPTLRNGNTLNLEMEQPMIAPPIGHSILALNA
ncbi:hypothetical protein HAX54_010450, partial [Datura stramonium]|nr:hypothetical protein [Datura stramonium]